MEPVTELLERKEKCLWLKNNVCKITEDKPCPDDCDLKSVVWEKDVILDRIREEQENIKKLKKEGMFKNRDKIGDKIAGLWVLENTLKKHFNYAYAHIVDKEVEKTASIFTKAFGRFRKRG